MHLLDGLNTAQLRASVSDSEVILTLAGAGSGKTTVLTRRVANLHINHRVGTSNMLALTFTRLAGKEMKERVIKLIGEQEGKKLFCNTFHAFAVMVLNEWGHLIGVDKQFSIFDQEDREAILVQIMTEFGCKISLKKVLDRFNCADGSRGHPEEERVIREYSYRLRQNNAVDLDKLIYHVNTLWSEHTEALEYYRRMYSHVFVDEFQDTNDEQMNMFRMLAPRNLFVVGDDFQAIYGWRGAKVGYIIDFPKEYPSCEVVKLEDNYRSTEPIVAAANKLISHNEKQTEKTLIAHKQGNDVQRASLINPMSEAAFIFSIIQDSMQLEAPLKSIAILARTNSHIDFLQRQLGTWEVPTQRVAGGDDVYKRGDVKSMISWLQIMFNPRDKVNLKKALRFPRAYLTDLQMQTIEFQALERDKELFEIIQSEASSDVGCGAFINLMLELDRLVRDRQVYLASDWMRYLIETLGIDAYYARHGLTNRMADVERAIGAMEAWERSKKQLGEDASASNFLKWLKYRDIQEKLVEEQDAVKLMTVHASKGLEFDTVFVAGLNEDVFPSKRTVDMEEERRLMYVAVTRAKERLFLTRAEQVENWNGELVSAAPSRFLTECRDSVTA
ncbi:ATP-dependent helicase [Paenibacillus mesophilus]|uniref:ATP-dependent helicase n=1 Tax=Paenibacillus mesophilus TaxID=2582849 RepID=UPI00110E0E4E|nr:ATP-dependent helicase [Paenibacillus mesophilus]TMV49390.1 ATP-dependent helicase [Paenibacillus mesophilus]